MWCLPFKKLPRESQGVQECKPNLPPEELSKSLMGIEWP